MIVGVPGSTFIFLPRLSRFCFQSFPLKVPDQGFFALKSLINDSYTENTECSTAPKNYPSSFFADILYFIQR